MIEHMRGEDYFKGKKITVIGLGLLGRGVGDTAFLAECGAELTVTDLRTEHELEESLNILSEYSNITYVLGEHRKEDFENRDFILVAAGVSMDSEYLRHASFASVPLKQSGAQILPEIFDGQFATAGIFSAGLNRHSAKSDKSA